MKRVLQAAIVILAIGAMIQSIVNFAEAKGPKVHEKGEPGI